MVLSRSREYEWSSYIELGRLVPMRSRTEGMDQWALIYKGIEQISTFPEELVQPSAEGIRPLALMSSELLTKYFWRRMPSEVKDGAAQEKILNGGTFNSHELILPLRRRTTPARACVWPPHFTIAQLRIDERLRCGSLNWQKQLWDDPVQFDWPRWRFMRWDYEPIAMSWSSQSLISCFEDGIGSAQRWCRSGMTMTLQN